MISTPQRPVSTGTRLVTMLIDHIAMTIVAMIFFIPVMAMSIASAFNATHDPGVDTMEGPLKYVCAIGFTLYFCKDIINGRSIAKRLLKLQVVDARTGAAASPMQCLVRDLFCVVWPVEVIVSLVNTQHRIGDRVAGTRLEYYNPSQVKTQAVGKARFLLPLAVAYAIIILFMQLLPSSNSSAASYVKGSYNRSASAELEKLLTDSLGSYIDADVRVYDTVQNEDARYVSLVLRLRENYLSDPMNYNALHRKVKALVYARLPEQRIIGTLRYVFSGEGQFQSRSTTIGSYRQGRRTL